MGNRHFPTVIALIMLIAMLGLMSNCQVKTDIPLEYQAPTDSSEHLDENGEPLKSGEQIQIGGNDSYVSVCRKHYKSAGT